MTLLLRQDITDRKKAELEQNRIAQDLRLLIDNANAPIFGIDKEGRGLHSSNFQLNLSRF